jgi:hypothetical protein
MPARTWEDGVGVKSRRTGSTREWAEADYLLHDRNVGFAAQAIRVLEHLQLLCRFRDAGLEQGCVESLILELILLDAVKFGWHTQSLAVAILSRINENQLGFYSLNKVGDIVHIENLVNLVLALEFGWQGNSSHPDCIVCWQTGYKQR